MFIESERQRTSSLQRSEIFGSWSRTLRSYGAKEVLVARSAINIWPLCGQAV